MFRSLSAFFCGLLAGVLLVAGVGFSQGNTVPAAVSRVRFMLGGKEVPAGNRPGYYFNGQTYVPAALNYRGTTYVPVRLVAELLGLKVSWDQATQSIILSRPPFSSPSASGSERKMALVKVKPEEAPPEVKELLERSLGIECAQNLTVGETTYLLVTRGAKPTAGYAVDIESAVDTGEEVAVTVRYMDPAPGAAVAQVLTHPYALAAIPKAGKPIRFQGVGDVFVPQLLGTEHLERIVTGTPNLWLFPPERTGAGLTVRGIARVFEGALSWEVLDQGGTRRVDQGYVQAAAGAPAWGYFHLTLPNQYVRENVFLRLFWSSPKDGAPSDVVEIALDAYAQEK